jgi:hypothetical protein
MIYMDLNGAFFNLNYMEGLFYFLYCVDLKLNLKINFILLIEVLFVSLLNL